ncbi:AraC family ligand binding domain-containing protein [Paenibacillus sp. P26]|nr:AraC family ligand binding domain-containing protein [Paenibacillus sp. P26]UUZ97156.1 AraC family ligand binding domain-containing protein [Paenibacillus sp. P25]
MKGFHLHDSYEIFYLLKGERVYFINDRVYTVQPGISSLSTRIFCIIRLPDRKYRSMSGLYSTSRAASSSLSTVPRGRAAAFRTGILPGPVSRR